MLNGKGALFTIGQFASLHSINKKTLMWYDEIGLFKPAVINKENKYRYYNYDQSPVLETILMLRDLNVPISDIQIFMENRSAASMKRLLNESIEELDNSIAHLKAVRKNLSHHHDDMAALLDIDLSQISIVEKEPQYLVTVGITPDFSLEKEIELVIDQIKKLHLPRMYNASYGSMISIENLYAGNFDDYSMLFIEMPNPAAGKRLHKQPGGKYLQAFSKGSWDEIPLRYEALLDYAQDHNLTLSDYAYEIGINEMVIDTIDDYITKIEIPLSENRKRSI